MHLLLQLWQRCWLGVGPIDTEMVTYQGDMGRIQTVCTVWILEKTPCKGGITMIELLFSHVWNFVTPWTAAHQVSLTVTWSLLKFMSIESVMPSNHFIFCHHLSFLPSIIPRIRGFSNESVLRIGWWKYWNFSISPSSKYSRLISFRIEWFNLLENQSLAVQGTLKSLLQHHSSKASILQWSAFLMGHLSHPYMTAGKTIALTR